jgi:hypothetical protein
VSGRVNRNANGLSRNPSSSEEDTIGARWHGKMDLEAIPKCHAFVYLCILLGCFKYHYDKSHPSKPHYHTTKTQKKFIYKCYVIIPWVL